MARRSVPPSTMSLLGLVRHLAEVERATFRVLMAGQDVPRLFCSDTDRDGDFDGAVPRPPGGRGGVDAWRAEADFATRFVAGAPSLDITGDDPLNLHGSGGGPMSLREALVGMIEEYARHMATPTCCASGSTGALASDDHRQGRAEPAEAQRRRRTRYIKRCPALAGKRSP